MKNRTLLFSLIMVFAMVFAKPLNAQMQQDAKYGFKINVPSNWSKNAYMDGTDKVYDFYSPDQNAAVQLRAFDATPEVTIDLLVQVYESSMLPAGTQKMSLVDHTSVNGIQGKQGLYSMVYNGIEVNMAAFYVVNNNKGYVLTAIIPSNMVEQKGQEVKSITQSFTLDAVKTSTPSQSLMGSLNTSGKVKIKSGRYNFTSRSDGKSLVNYHYILIEDDGGYVERYQPKNSGNYEGGNNGRWSINGNKLLLKHDNSTVVDEYIVQGDTFARTSDGVTFYFKKQ